MVHSPLSSDLSSFSFIFIKICTKSSRIFVKIYYILFSWCCWNLPKGRTQSCFFLTDGG